VRQGTVTHIDYRHQNGRIWYLPWIGRSRNEAGRVWRYRCWPICTCPKLDLWRRWIWYCIQSGSCVVRGHLMNAQRRAAPLECPCRKRILAGMITGGVGQAVASPTDVVKVRLQADGRLIMQGKQPRYKVTPTPSPPFRCASQGSLIRVFVMVCRARWTPLVGFGARKVLRVITEVSPLRFNVPL
jgi:hypothetical protein